MDQKLLERIVKGCVEGRREQQHELYRLFADEMFRVCMYYSRDYQEAQDVMQEGFIRVFRSISTFRYQGSLAGWIKRIMINVALEKYRKEHPLQVVTNSYTGNEKVEVDDDLSEVDARDLVGFIQELSPQYRMVFNLFAVEGYSHKEIGKLLGISEGTSKSNLSRARAILQGKVEKYYYSSAKNIR